MATTIVRVYRSSAGQSQNFYVEIQVDNGQFVLDPPQIGFPTLDQISRVDFFDQQGNTLLVIPAFPINSSIYLANAGQVIQFRLELRNFLGGPSFHLPD